MKSKLLFLLLLLFSIHVGATDISGGIYANTTWTLSGSPYNVTGDVVVFDDVLLTIEPGVEIRFNGNYMLEVRGRIIANGTASAKITFRGNTASYTRGFWKGIVFVGTSAPLGSGNQATFSHCNISNAYYGLDFNIAYHGPYTFRNCSFTYNMYVNNDGGSGGMLFDSCSLMHNYYGFRYFQFGGRISNTVFDNNQYGVDGSDTLIGCTFTNHSQIAAQPYGYTNNCTFMNNKVAVRCPFNSENTTLINSRIMNNTEGMDMITFFNGENVFSNNELCNNTLYDLRLGGKLNANLSKNCWCSTDSATIRSKIIDGYVDVSRGLVKFMPVRSSCVATVYVPELAAVADVEVYPNPVSAQGWVHIKSAIGIELNDVQLTDMLGRQYLCEVYRNGDKHYSVKLPACAPGIYTLIITGEEAGRIAKRIDVR